MPQDTVSFPILSWHMSSRAFAILLGKWTTSSSGPHSRPCCCECYSHFPQLARLARCALFNSFFFDSANQDISIRLNETLMNSSIALAPLHDTCEHQCCYHAVHGALVLAGRNSSRRNTVLFCEVVPLARCTGYEVLKGVLAMKFWRQ